MGEGKILGSLLKEFIAWASENFPSLESSNFQVWAFGKNLHGEGEKKKKKKEEMYVP